MPQSMERIKNYALQKIASFNEIAQSLYDEFSDKEEEIFGADGVAVPQVRFGNGPVGSLPEFLDEMIYLASSQIYKGRKLRPREVSGRIHSMLISRAGRIAKATGYKFYYANGAFFTDYVAPERVELPPAPEDEAREEWEALLLEASMVLEQEDRDNLFAEMVRLEDANV